MCGKLEVEQRKDEKASVWCAKDMEREREREREREGKDHVTDCYLCMTHLQGLF